MNKPEPKVCLILPHSRQFRLRRNESEGWPPARLDRPLELRPGACRIALHEIPVSQPKAERCNVDIAGV